MTRHKIRIRRHAKTPRQSPLTRRMELERMEERLLFSRDEGAFASAGSLTFSFPPDDTNVGQQVNNLGTGLQSLGTTDQIRESIAKSFQTWLRQANVNFGMVDDSGAAIGVYGPTRGDARFGDVRITGFDFSTDTFAEAVSEDSRSVGTWAGDIFFNTAAAWPSLSAFQGASLHEIGHVLGLEHSLDPNSVMHTHGGNGVTSLTDDDIAAVQGLHGARGPDANEGDHGNDTIARASELRGADDDESAADGFDGSQVWIQFGDLLNSQDRDVYEIKTQVGYQGPMAIELRTKGLSLARLRVEVTDRDGNVLDSGGVVDTLGGTVILEIPQAQGDEKYYVQVFSGTDPFWAQGDYSVTVATPARLAADGTAIADWSRNAHRWYFDSEGARRGFSWQTLPTPDDHPDLDEDNNSDDTSVAARELTPVISTPSRSLYRTIGTLSNLVDLDHYRIQAPSNPGATIDLVVDVESLELEGLVPDAEILNHSGVVQAAEVRVRGYGLYQIVLPNASPGDDYIIRLKSTNTSDAFKLGNFSLTAQFGAPREVPIEMISGTLTDAKPSLEREWYVARPQLFSLSLSSNTAGTVGNGQVWVTVFDQEKKVVSAVVAPIGQLRTSPGLLLDPGTYFLQVAMAADSASLPDTSVVLSGEIVSDPIGPVVGTTGVQPKFLCPGQTAQYCYPNTGTPTAVPTSVSTSAPTTSLPTPSSSPAQSTADLWYWQNDFRPTNPTRALDSNGDGLISPLDALVVINRLNVAGSTPFPSPPIFVGYLDTTADGLISPLDALVIINDLNLHGVT